MWTRGEKMLCLVAFLFSAYNLYSNGIMSFTTTLSYIPLIAVVICFSILNTTDDDMKYKKFIFLVYVEKVLWLVLFLFSVYTLHSWGIMSFTTTLSYIPLIAVAIYFVPMLLETWHHIFDNHQEYGKKRFLLWQLFLLCKILYGMSQANMTNTKEYKMDTNKSWYTEEIFNTFLYLITYRVVVPIIHESFQTFKLNNKLESFNCTNNMSVFAVITTGLGLVYNNYYFEGICITCLPIVVCYKQSIETDDFLNSTATWYKIGMQCFLLKEMFNLWKTNSYASEYLLGFHILLMMDINESTSYYVVLLLCMLQNPFMVYYFKIISADDDGMTPDSSDFYDERMIIKHFYSCSFAWISIMVIFIYPDIIKYTKNKKPNIQYFAPLPQQNEPNIQYFAPLPQQKKQYIHPFDKCIALVWMYAYVCYLCQN